MPDENFARSCDRLSQIVDAALAERLRWERNEGPMLARLVALAQSAFEGRSEFELVEEGATRDIKRFVLKIHGYRVMAIAFRIASGRAVATSEAIERSKYRLADGGPISADFAEVNEEWMATTLRTLFDRVQAPPQPPADNG